MQKMITTHSETMPLNTSLLSNNKSALVMFNELLFELSMADGHLDPAEESILSEAIPIFGLDHDMFNKTKESLEQIFQTHMLF